MNVGEFFEARESSEDEQWCKLDAEEIPLRIKAMMGRRGRPPNPNKQRPQKQPKVKRGKGRPPKVKTVTLLNNTDAKLMKKLESQAVLNEKEKQKLKALMNKLKQKGQAKLKPGQKIQRAQRVKKNQKEKQVKKQQRLKQKQQRLQLLQEMKKPTEDLYLTDHKPLPEFVPIPGLVLSGRAFSDCLTVIEFLHNYGKVLGFDTSKDVPTLNTLQEGLLNVEDCMGDVQDLLIRLLHIAVVDPGLPHKYQSVTFLGERICDIGINRDNVSEVLRIFLEAYGAEAELCEGLKSKSFQAHCSEKKAAVLAFLVNELLGSSVVIREIDKNIDHRANIRKNKWIVEGKLRRLKRALAKKKGIREPDGIVEGRRRKQGLGPEEDHNSNAAGNGDEESVKEETKEKTTERKTEGINKADDHPPASVAELNRQIEKLSKRQSFFARKLLQVSQTLRALLLGQDRFRRRYWVFPHLSGVFVEGSEGSLGTEELDAEKNQFKLIETVPVKVEPRDVLNEKPNILGRPKDSRRRKCETELVNPENPKRHRAAANVKHYSVQDTHSTNQTHHNVDQSAVFLAWLSLLQNSVSNLSLPTPHCSTSKDSPSAISPEMLLASNRKLFDLSVPNSEQKVKDCAEKHGQWFSLLPRMPCDSSSITQLPFSSQQTSLNQSQRLDSDLNQLSHSPLKLPASAAFATSQFMPFMDIPFDMQSAGSLNPAATYGTSVAASLRADPTATRGMGKSHQSEGAPQNECPLPRIPRRRGRPSKLLKEINQRQLKPVPAEMQRGWWCIGSLEELNFLLKALHPRGVREKALHKQLLKHMDYVSQACIRENTDSIFSNNNKEGSVTREMVEKWKPEKWAFPVDLGALQYLEVLEQRVISASLQVKGWTSPDTDSTRDDLVYFDQQWLVSCDGKVKDEEVMELMRRNNNPLDLAVTRLATLELNVERRYLKEPLWVPGKLENAGTVSTAPAECVDDAEQYSNEGHISPGLSVWRETLLKCTNAAQVFMCIQQLEKAIAWEKSVMKVSCQICRKGDKDELLLLCDNCDQGCHTYCLKPKIVEIPEGDWFCPICITKASNRSVRSGTLQRQSKQRRDGRRSAHKVSSVENFVHHCPRKYMKKQRRKCLSRGGTPVAKRKKMSTRNQSSDLTLCEVILMEMESHEDAWPFLHPVNPRLVPGYRKIIKKPMDFATIRGNLISGKYLSCKEFAADTTLVFDNCVTFNEDDSEVGRAGYVMRKFFESRWAEFYHSS